MARSALQPDLLARILACPRPVVALTGPAGTGKTTAAIDLYEHFHDAGQPACLLLAPNRIAAEQLRRRLLARAPHGVLPGPLVMTFDDLAERLLAAGRVEHRPISPVHRRAALQAIVRDLLVRRRLTALAGVADTPGLLAAVDRSISELKRAAIDPEAFARAIGSARTGRHADLLRIYAAYQQYLQAHRLYDAEGRTWQARLEAERLGANALPGVRAAVVDGFTDLSPTQLDVLKVLARPLERLVVTLPHAEEPARARLWHWTGRQLEQIRGAFGGDCCTIPLSAAAPGAIGETAGRLFRIDPPPAGWPDGLHVVAAAGLESECRAIARWTKRHLAAGVPADDLAVIARDVEPYRAALPRIFVEAGLPAPPRRADLARTPPARLLLTAVRAADGFGHAEVLGVLSNSYFRPAALGPFDPATPAVAQLLVRRGNVVGGRAAYAEAFARLAERITPGGLADDEEFNHPLDQHLARLGAPLVEQATSMVEALFARLDALAGGGTLPELAAATLGLIDALDLRGAVLATAGAPRAGDGPTLDLDAADAERLAADLRALAALQDALRELATLTDEPIAGRRLGAGEFADMLAALLAQVACPPPRTGASILLAGALDARALSARHVWLAGLNEGVFPATAGEQALVGEADRRAWSSHGVRLDGRDDLVAREMLLFYLCATRALESLCVSYLAADAAGRPMERSEFLAALLRAAGGERPRHVETLPPAQFAPPPERIVSRRELLNAAMDALGRAPDDPRALAGRGAAELARRRCAGELAALAGPLWAVHRRWRFGRCDAFDGVLDDPALLAELRRAVPEQSIFSVSQVNTLLRCPWAYFARWMLRLTPLEDPTEELLPRSRGLLAHAVLRRMVLLLADDGPDGVPLPALPRARLTEALEFAIQAETAEALRFGAAYPTLWDSELRQLRVAVEGCLDRHIDLAGGLAGLGYAACRTAYLELAFGLGSTPGGDPASVPGPLVLDGPAGQVRLCGKIDRVDVLSDGRGGEQALVVDYKTGHVPRETWDVQLPVYIRAVEDLLGLPAAGGVFQGVRTRRAEDRLLARFKTSRGQLKPDDGYDDRLRAALDGLHGAIARLAAGDLACLPEHGCDGSRCPYRRICGYSRSRGGVKAPEVPVCDQPEASPGV